jgi:hypothetical protein
MRIFIARHNGTIILIITNSNININRAVEVLENLVYYVVAVRSFHSEVHLVSLSMGVTDAGGCGGIVPPQSSWRGV